LGILQCKFSVLRGKKHKGDNRHRPFGATFCHQIGNDIAPEYPLWMHFLFANNGDGGGTPSLVWINRKSITAISISAPI
jgi:hypothetical protein